MITKRILGAGEKDKARRHFQEAHAIFLHVYGPEHPSTKTVKKWLDLVRGGD